MICKLVVKPNLFIESLKEKNQKIEELEKEKKEWNTKIQPYKDKIEGLEENEKNLRKMVDDGNMLSEGYVKRIKELESQRVALATDVATLEEEVAVTRKHASERFELARQKQEIESKLETAEKELKELRTENGDLKERAKLFIDISNK